MGRPDGLLLSLTRCVLISKPCMVGRSESGTRWRSDSGESGSCNSHLFLSDCVLQRESSQLMGPCCQLPLSLSLLLSCSAILTSPWFDHTPTPLLPSSSQIHHYPVSHRVRFVLPKYSWVWGHTLKENWLFHSQKPLTVNGSSVRGKSLSPSPAPR